VFFFWGGGVVGVVWGGGGGGLFSAKNEKACSATIELKGMCKIKLIERGGWLLGKSRQSVLSFQKEKGKKIWGKNTR